MKFVLFSDVHGNLEALESFLEHIDRIQYDRIYNLGDIIGYGADPNECLELIQQRDIPCVVGNHDDVVLDKYDPEAFNPDARQALLWCRKTVREDNIDFLRTLKDFIWIDSALGKALLVHGSPVDKDEYVMSRWHAERAFVNMAARDIVVSFVAHTHQPCCWLQNPDGTAEFRPPPKSGEPVRLNPSYKAIVNVGSVGQPRDSDPRGGFVIWDDEEHSVLFRRFTYPVAKAQKKIREAGLPPFLADRLAEGF
jgi:predicted phosphodiesterase